MTEAPGNVVEALSRVMVELPAIGKDERMSAPGSPQYNYRGIEAITKEAQVLFGRYGIVPIPRVQKFETKDIEVNGKPWIDLTMWVVYEIFGPGGTSVMAGPFVAMAREGSDKGTLKCLTQAYKMMLLQVLMVSDKKDDPDTERHERDARPDMTLISEAKVANLRSGCEKYDLVEETVVADVTEGRTQDPHGITEAEWPKVRDIMAAAKEAQDRRLAAPPGGDGDSSASLSEESPPAPSEPEPQPAGGRGRARLGSKKDEEGS